ncbi:MAG: TolB family protein [Syntrophothermus sp.]
MKAKLTIAIFFAVLLPLLFSSCDNREQGNNPGQSVSSIYVVKTDGSDQKEIANGGWGKYTFLPNSNKILYTSFTHDYSSGIPGGTLEYYGLYIINPDGSGNRPLLVNDHKINWISASPDNKKVLISAGDGIYVLDAEGEITIRQIQASLQDIRKAYFSMDMTKIAFQQKYDVNIMDASGSNIKTIKKANDTTSYLFAGFAFDDSALVYIEKHKSDSLYHFNTYSLKSGTETKYNYGEYLFSESEPFYALNDGTVLYKYGHDIRVFNLVNFWLASRVIAKVDSFSLSNDKKKVIYLGEGGGRTIYTINIDGTDNKAFYSDKTKSLNIGGPVLSSDGQYLIFSGWRIE